MNYLQATTCSNNETERQLPMAIMNYHSNGSTSNSRTYTLYLIRHAQAIHNVYEKSAMKRALEAAVADGFKADSAEARMRMEEAREVVLQDKSFFDAPLTDRGQEETAAARKQIREWTCGSSSSENNDTTADTPTLTESLLPPPTEVFVSPLQRALQTADLIFPDHSNIIVREELRERMTGRPADNRMASHLSEKQFRRFSFVRLRLNSFFEIKSMHPFRKKDGLEDCDDEDNDQDESMPKPSPINTKRLVSMESSFNSEVREDEAKLRQRTMKIFELLTHSQHDSVAIVTHKGYLRGLERGALGQPDATEFQNCEVRVYKVTFSPGTKILDHVERLR